MAIPLTVKQYKLKEYLSRHLDSMTFEEVMEAVGVPVPDADSAEHDSWTDALTRVRNRLLS